MNKIRITTALILIYWFSLAGCSYIPFTPECERLPKDLSYYGIVAHFGREPDFIDYRISHRANNKTYKYMIYYWGTCNGKTILAYIYERTFELNEYGMSVVTNSVPYVELAQTSIEVVKGE